MRVPAVHYTWGTDMFTIQSILGLLAEPSIEIIPLILLLFLVIQAFKRLGNYVLIGRFL
jgi:hypothetical protein